MKTMKKTVVLALVAIVALAGASVQAQAQKGGKKKDQPFIEGVQKVRQSDYLTYDRFTNFSTKDVNRYFTPFNYADIPALTQKNNPAWGDLQPVMNYLEKVSRASLTMCAIYAVNPDVEARAERDRLSRQARDEAQNALAAFDTWKAKKQMRNKVQYRYAEVDYRYFKGANFYNEQNSSDIIHVGLILYFGSKKKAVFDADTTSRTFADIKFFPNDATIVDSWQPHLDDIANYLKENDRKGLLVSGYADNQGTAEYAVGLSRQRAMEVKKALQMRGIDASRIEVQAMGSADPVGDNDTYEGRVANNRVSIKIQ